MAYHITKQSRMAGIGTMYYADNNRWTDVYENRKVYPTLFQAEDGIRDLVRSRGLGDVYKRQR